MHLLPKKSDLQAVQQIFVINIILKMQTHELKLTCVCFKPFTARLDLKPSLSVF